MGCRIPSSKGGRSGTYTRFTARVVEIMERSIKPKTTRLYQRSWGMFNNFTQGVYGKGIALPLSENQIVMFIALMEEQGYGRVTIRTFTSALSYLHKMKGLSDPARGLVVKMLVTVGNGQVTRMKNE